MANLYPPEKDKRRLVKSDNKDLLNNGDQFDEKILNQLEGNEMWILRMISPHHNHASEPPSLSKKKKLKNSRILVEKPLPKPANYNSLPYSQGTSREVAEQISLRKLEPGRNDFYLDTSHQPQPQIPQQMMHHQDLQDPDVLAAISNNVNSLNNLSGLTNLNNLNNMNLPNLNMNSVNADHIDPNVQDMR